MFSNPVADKRIYLVGQLIKAFCDAPIGKIVEVAEGPNMLPNSGGPGM